MRLLKLAGLDVVPSAGGQGRNPGPGCRRGLIDIPAPGPGNLTRKKWGQPPGRSLLKAAFGRMKWRETRPRIGNGCLRQKWAEPLVQRGGLGAIRSGPEKTGFRPLAGPLPLFAGL